MLYSTGVKINRNKSCIWILSYYGLSATVIQINRNNSCIWISYNIAFSAFFFRLIETIVVFECKSCGFKSILEWWLIETIVVFEFFTASGKSFLLQD